ncbi:MAG TPA: OmpA family protein [Bryobacteraceae bacterium]|nr:OmpA family protein [Bryobacteraceae bacterium]
MKYFFTLKGEKSEQLYRVVGFARGSSELNPQQKVALEAAVVHKVYGNFAVNGAASTIYLTGTHSEPGSAAANAYLAGLRALSVKKFLLSKMLHFPESRVIARGSSVVPEIDPAITAGLSSIDFYQRAVEIRVTHH